MTADLRTEPERRGSLLERRRAADRRRAGSGRDEPADDATFVESTLLVTPTPSAGRASASGPAVSFSARLTLALLTAALLPILGLGGLLVALGAFPADPAAPRLVLLAGVVTSLLGVLFASFLSATLTAPLRAIAAAVDQVSAGNLGTPIEIEGDDELARLAESHNRLAADRERRNRELGQILAAIDRTSVDAGTELLLERAAADARRVFGLVDVELRLVDPASVLVEPRVPGEPLPIRAELRAGDEAIGLLIGHAPATRRWDRGDQDLFALFASEVGAALRTADLFGRVERQNTRLVELDAAKDEFLRGVSHNLQTPLTSIRAYADQLAVDSPDRRLAIIREQSDRLSRMVRQLLTVSRLESGALRPRTEVLAPGSRIRRTWEALGAHDVELSLHDESDGWLALADPDHLDQVLWALFDNAVKYGDRRPIDVLVTADADSSRVRVRITDHGPGVVAEDRGRLFGRFQRGADSDDSAGSGLGLYVSRELMRAMGGDLALDDDPAGEPPGSDSNPDRRRIGASFSLWLPAEPGLES